MWVALRTKFRSESEVWIKYRSAGSRGVTVNINGIGGLNGTTSDPFGERCSGMAAFTSGSSRSGTVTGNLNGYIVALRLWG